MLRRALLIFALSATPALAGPAEDFRRLQDDYWAWQLRENPTLASRVGNGRYDGLLPDISLTAEDRRSAERQGFLDRLEAIPETGLSEADTINRVILQRRLSDDIEANRYPQRVMLFTTYYGWHQDFVGLADDLPFRNGADHRSYLDRLRRYPQLNDAALEITERALRGGFVLPCSALGGYEKTIAGVITQRPEDSRFFGPFLRPRPADVSEQAWLAMRAEARETIAHTINPAYRKHLDFYLRRYVPHCAKADGISAQPGGSEYYAFRVRRETTTDLTPDQIHAIGLAEVARIGVEMDKVAARTGHASRASFIAELRTAPIYYAGSAAQLLEESSAAVRTIETRLPDYFGRLPRLPLVLKAVPPETAEGTTTAYYSPGAPESGIAGTFYVNTSKLDQRPLWEIPALAAHEAVPGHHLQIALQQELDLPLWRRHDASFTAFVEGWGLYAERLVAGMGLYDSAAKQMGRLSYEMWRACRLVVDTGIHAKGWTKAQATRFMTDNSALTAANIEAEVNRYISWPGQALAYKIGERKILELRGEAERRLGRGFDIRAFHEAVLGNGAMPLDTLQQQIERWIARQERETNPPKP